MLKFKFRYKDNHVDPFTKLGILNNIFLDLTNKCQINCLYCFNRHKINSEDHDFNLNLLEKILKSSISKNIENWFLSGGEPLCYPCLDDALKLFQNYGHSPKIATNGLMLTPEILSKWISYGVQSVQFSIDSLNVKTYIQLSKGTEDNYYTVLANLKNAVNSPIRVVVSSVLNKTNINELPEIMKKMEQIGVDSQTIYLYTPSNQLKKMADLMLPFSELPQALSFLFSTYYSMPPPNIVDINLPFFKYSKIYSQWKDKINFRLHSCGAGQLTLNITTQGLVSPCICQDANEFIVGDLNKSGLEEIWHSPALENFRHLYSSIPECSSCKLNHFCRGGCRNNAYVFGDGGLSAMDPLCQVFVDQG